MGNTSRGGIQAGRSSTTATSVVADDNPLHVPSTSTGRLHRSLGYWSPTIDNRLSTIDGVQLLDQLKSLSVLHQWPADLLTIVASYALRQWFVLLGGGPRQARADFMVIDPMSHASYLTSPLTHRPLTAHDAPPGTLIARTLVNQSGSIVHDPSISSSSQPSWIRLSWLPQPRKQTVAARFGDSIFIGGGLTTNDVVLATVIRLQMATGEWATTTPSMPTGRYGACSGVAHGEWIVCGGISAYSKLDATALNTVESYNVTRNEWTTLPSMITPRTNAACAVFGGQLYVCGGDNGRGVALSSVECYNPIHGRWIQCMPLSVPRSGAACCVMNHLGIWITGGSTTTRAEDALRSAQFYSPTSDIWTQEIDLPGPMCHHSCQYVENHIIVSGGMSHQRLIPESYALGITSVTSTPIISWLRLADLPQANAYMSSLLI